MVDGLAQGRTGRGEARRRQDERERSRDKERRQWELFDKLVKHAATGAWRRTRARRAGSSEQAAAAAAYSRAATCGAAAGQQRQRGVGGEGQQSAKVNEPARVEEEVPVEGQRAGQATNGQERGARVALEQRQDAVRMWKQEGGARLAKLELSWE